MDAFLSKITISNSWIVGSICSLQTNEMEKARQISLHRYLILNRLLCSCKSACGKGTLGTTQFRMVVALGYSIQLKNLFHRCIYMGTPLISVPLIASSCLFRGLWREASCRYTLIHSDIPSRQFQVLSLLQGKALPP